MGYNGRMATSPTEKTQIVGCGRCGARFRAANALAGTRRVCPACGETLSIPPAQDDVNTPSSRDAAQAQDSGGAGAGAGGGGSIGFECRNCQTRLLTQARYAGWRMRCPDCGAKTVVPKPAERRKKKTPSALSGEQYDVWPVDAEPSAAELFAAAPPSVSFECSLCGTRLTAAVARVGTPFACPDCGAKTPVPPPEIALPSKRKTELEGYELDEAFAPSATPEVVFSEAHERSYEELGYSNQPHQRPDKDGDGRIADRLGRSRRASCRFRSRAVHSRGNSSLPSG